jgi:hypothetical protein
VKIQLTQKEFETMASAWVYENLVEKTMVSAKIVGDSVELEVFGPDDEPEKEEEDKPEVIMDDDVLDYNEIRTGNV